MSEWIDVADRLPGKAEGDCLLYDSQFMACTVGYFLNDRWNTFVDSWSHDDVTHWQPLPEPPSS